MRPDITKTIRYAIAMVVLTLIRAPIALAALPYSDFFTAADPQHFGLTIFTSGMGAEAKYAATHEGFELEQTLTPYINLVGRVSGYQVYTGDGWDTPLAGRDTRPRNFGVLQGGLDFLPFQGTSFKMLGGSDVGDSHHSRIEGDFSSWLWMHSRHPVNLAFIGDHFYNNGLDSGAIDIRTIWSSSREVMWLVGAGGQLWAQGGEPNLQKEFGPDLGIMLCQWNLSLDFQAGYGSNHGYGLIGVSRHFGWDED